MQRLIDAEALKKSLQNFFQGLVIKNHENIDEDIFYYIDNAPTECEKYRSFCMAKQRPQGGQVVPDMLQGWRYDERPHDKWKNYNSYFKTCSLCNKTVGFDYIEQSGERFNYCPNCGADMRGDSNE